MLFNEFISTYGTTIIYALLSAAATAIGAWIGKMYKEKCNDETKRKVVKTCCKAVKQIYKDLKGEELYNKAVESIVAMLNQKGITITDLEIKMLIEEVCSDFADAVEDEIKTKEEIEDFKESIESGVVIND